LALEHIAYKIEKPMKSQKLLTPANFKPGKIIRTYLNFRFELNVNIFTLILFFIFPISLSAQKVITVNFDSITGTVKDLQAGNLYFEPTAVLLHDEGINTIRVHDMHHALDYYDYSTFWNIDSANTYTINQNFDPCNPADYIWHKADSVLDLLTDYDFNIFFRIGVSYPNPNISPPSPYDPPTNSDSESFNFSRFALLVKQTVRHYNEGWDNGRYFGIKYWEVWNEPGGLFWNGTPEQFYQMYKAVADTVKDYAPDIFIGAPGSVPVTTIGNKPEYREDFVNFCAQNNLPLDFYSWHIYGYKNPYGIKELADTIRSILDINGYTGAESIVSEINNNLDSTLDTLAISPYGAAYYLSTLLTAQEAPIDKLYWYPSCVGIKINQTGDTLSSRTYYAFTCFEQLRQSTPVEVLNDGDIVVDGNWNSYEKNFMVLSAKSNDYEKYSVLISNLSSNVSEIELHLQNLPFTPSDSVLVTKHIINEDFVYKTETYYITGNNSITITDNHCPNPGVLFYQLEKVPVSSIEENTVSPFIVFSPVRDKLYYKNLPGNTHWMELYSLSGELILREKRIVSLNIPEGTYLLVLKDEFNHVILTKKIIKLD